MPGPPPGSGIDRVRSLMSGRAVRRELESRRIGVHGLTTVKRSLTRLKRLGLLRGAKRSPVGYSLAGDLPGPTGLLPAGPTGLLVTAQRPGYDGTSPGSAAGGEGSDGRAGGRGA